MQPGLNKFIVSGYASVRQCCCMCHDNWNISKAGVSPLALRISEEDRKPVPSKGWAAMIRKVY
jgi:hypothetical protein